MKMLTRFALSQALEGRELFCQAVESIIPVCRTNFGGSTAGRA
jgi:hypothetical protein